MKIIARIRSDFPTKFGIPRQSGRVEELTACIVFEPEYRVREAVKGLEIFRISGCCGSFHSRSVRTGPLQYVRHAWAEMKGWAYLPPDRPSVPIL